MKLKVCVIVLNYRRHRDTENCLKKLEKSDVPPGTIFVCVDNSPGEESFHYLSQKFPKLRLIKAPRNLGFAGGNNLGIRHALKEKCTHMLIINPDVEVGRTFFGPLLEVFKKEKKTGLVAPAIKHYQNGQLFYGLEGHLDWRFATAKHINLPDLKSKELRPAEFVTFACVLIGADVFRKVGLLDDRYFMYLEDVDYCLSCRRAGWQIFLNPAVIVSHQTSSSFKRPTDKLFISFGSQLRFINEWLGFPANLVPLGYAFLFYPYLFILWTYFDLKRKVIK